MHTIQVWVVSSQVSKLITPKLRYYLQVKRVFPSVFKNKHTYGISQVCHQV